MKSGARKVKRDHRDFSFRRTFGSVLPSRFPDEYNCDAGFGFPNQDADGLPYGCTGYTQSELCQDEDGTRYKPQYTYDRTRMMEGTVGQVVGCDIRDALKSTIVYGVQAPTETTEQEAELHRRGQYFNVIDPFNSTDSFDDVRNALWLNRLEKRSVSLAIPWFPEWMGVQSDGVLPQPHDLDSTRASWHNAKITGWKTINGAPYLMCKAWQGPQGDNGWCYFGRDLFNQIMRIDGTGAFTLSKAKPSDIRLIQLTIFQTILSYLRMLALKL